LSAKITNFVCFVSGFIFQVPAQLET
jgi:hypothetical protein